MRLTIIGGGLAGCEAAWQAARFGAEVDLYEMRPQRTGPAHHTGDLAELVCSNSLRGDALENAVGLLKAELERLDSIIVVSARESAVPAGGALAVDRARFAAAVTAKIRAHPRITLHRAEVQTIADDEPTIVACGPLPAEALAAEIDRIVGRGRLHYYDAAAPIVAADSIDERLMYRKSRYDKGAGDDYLNIPLDRAQYAAFVRDLRDAPKHAPKEFELDAAAGNIPYFEGCLPIEEMALRGDDVMRFGPLKPVGLRDPRSGATPHAVVQLRNENADGSALNLVGFQTRLTWPAQKAVFGQLPGLADAEWLRYGVMHRNTFLDSPRLLGCDLRFHGARRLWFAGQITGAEGYVEAAACGLIAGIAAARQLRGLPHLPWPATTAHGAVLAHLGNTASPDFQPANVNWGAFPPLAAAEHTRDKSERRRRMAHRALAALEDHLQALAAPQLTAAGAVSRAT